LTGVEAARRVEGRRALARIGRKVAVSAADAYDTPAMNRRSLAVAIVLSAGALCCAAGVSRAANAAPETVRIPVDNVAGAGMDSPMVAGVFRPAGDGPFPVVIYSHGRSGTDVERSETRVPDLRSHLRYWLAKGFAVVAPIRPGYGETGGIDRENSGVRYDIFGNCWGPPDFRRSASAAATAVLATLVWVRQQAWADASRVILTGVSMGGLASVATAATDPPGVAGYVNFSGGTGGNGRRAPGHSCGSEEMEKLMSSYGRTTHVPSLWLYAENDTFWGSDWPRAWHRAFASGGSHSDFVMTAPVPNADGHQLLARGVRLWTAHVDRFLGEIGFE
jgi:dienelactone hydrolase